MLEGKLGNVLAGGGWTLFPVEWRGAYFEANRFSFQKLLCSIVLVLKQGGAMKLWAFGEYARTEAQLNILEHLMQSAECFRAPLFVCAGVG